LERVGTITHPRAWLDRRRARAEADHWIGHGFEARYPWRVAELTSERQRRVSARGIHSVIGELNGSKLPGAAPLRIAALRPHVQLLESLETRLLDGAPVKARGMLAVAVLLTSAGSCLYAENDDVASCLRSVHENLEVN
jgi:hypothetical protein